MANITKAVSILFSAVILFTTSLSARELRQSGTWENICAHPAPLPVLGHITPIKSDLNRTSVWSVGCETMDRDYADFSKFKQYVGLTGVGYARLQSGWNKTEQKKGKYDFAWLDAHVDGLIEQGVHPWMCLCYGNSIYSNHGVDLDAKLFPDGPIMDGWLAYVKTLVKRYKGKVTMYEIWNEPDNQKALDSYSLYANLFVRTAKVIKEIDPDVKIAAFGSCSPDLKYIRQATEIIAERGALDYMDYITYHAYWQCPERIIPAVQQLKKDISAYSDKIGLLQGETGCPGQLEYAHAMHSIEWNEYSQAKWDLRSMFTHWSLGNPYSIFTMVDLNYGYMLQSYGLIRTNLHSEPIYFRPKFYAVQHMVSILTSDIHPSTEVTVSSDCGRKIMSVGLEKDGKVVGCAIWFGDRRPESGLERQLVSVSVRGLPIKKSNIVYVDMLTGNVHRIPELDRSRGAVFEDGFEFSQLPLWDCPIILMDKDYISFK